MIVSLSKSYSVDFGPIVKKMEKGDMTPRDISDARNKVAGSLSRIRFIMGTIAAERARAVDACRDNYRSMAAAERAWEATPSGQEEVQLHHQIKALEAMLGALETNWFLLQGEARQSH